MFKALRIWSLKRKLRSLVIQERAYRSEYDCGRALGGQLMDNSRTLKIRENWAKLQALDPQTPACPY